MLRVWRARGRCRAQRAKTLLAGEVEGMHTHARDLQVCIYSSVFGAAPRESGLLCRLEEARKHTQTARAQVTFAAAVFPCLAPCASLFLHA